MSQGDLGGPPRGGGRPPGGRPPAARWGGPPSSAPRPRGARPPAARPSALANRDGLQSLGEEISRSQRSNRRRSSRRRRRARRLLTTLGVVILLVVGTVAGYGWYLNHQIHRVDVKNLTPGATTGAEA
ncbi:MAG: hypothetical protein M0007_07700, partial [Actinomycetota bacterium]|nr:hypothetical protein [Actinomycetota bacterium]